MDHPLRPDPRRVGAMANAWSAIGHDAIASLHIVTRIIVEDDATLVVRRELLDGEGAIVASVVDFSLPCADRNAAALRLKVAKGISSTEALVGKSLLLLGTDRFQEDIEEGVVALQAEMAAADRSAINVAEAEAVLARTVRAYFEGDKRSPSIALCRGDSTDAAWSIHFGETWERDRFWGWMRWQRARFPEFLESLEATDASTLRSRLLREMIETEQAARKNKLTTSGRRPLRFWCGEVA